jgi:hypothetical protein
VQKGKKTLGAAIKLIKGTGNATVAIGKLIKKYPKTAILAASGAAYGASDASNFADKQRVKMMLENHRKGTR